MQPLCTLAAGFVRVAAEQGAALVPVLCLGEVSALRNLIDLPAVQVRLLLADPVLWFEHGQEQMMQICMRPAMHLRAIVMACRVSPQELHPMLFALRAPAARSFLCV